MSAFANPVTWIVAAVLLAACAGSAGSVARLGRLLTRPPTLIALGILVAANLVARVALGLVAPGDFAGEIVAARSLEAGGPLYSPDMAQDRVAVRLIPAGPLAAAIVSRLPEPLAMQARERNAVGIAAQSHPPTVFAALVPLIRIGGSETAFLVVSAASVAAAAWLAWYLASATVTGPNRRQIVLAALLVAGWQPSLAAIRDGQLSVVIAACAIAGWWSVRREGERAGGVLIGIGTALKFYPGALLLAVALQSRRALAWVLLTLAGCVLVTLFVFAPQSWIAYGSAVREGTLGHLASGTNLSIGARLWHVLPRAAAIQCWLACSLSLLALTFWRSFRERTLPGGFDLAFARFSCLAIVLSPTAWGHYLPLLTQPFAVLLNRSVESADRWRLAAAAGLALLLSLPIAETTGIWSLGTIGWTNALLSPTTPILALWAVLMAESPARQS